MTDSISNAALSKHLELASTHTPHLLRSASDNYPNKNSFTAAIDDAAEVAGRPLSISPLALCVNLPSKAKQVNSRALLDALISEARHYSKDFGRRPITQLLLRHPFVHYQGAEITELMHQLASSFKLGNKDQTLVENCVELTPAEITSENLALLKGLGFNELMLGLPSHYGTKEKRQLLDCWQVCLAYEFDSIAVRLPYGFEQQDLHGQRQLLDFLLEVKPSRIKLSPAQEICQWDLEVQASNDASASGQFAMIYSALRNAGYRVLANDMFILGRDILATAQNQNRLRRTTIGYNAGNASDILGLGPGSISQLDMHYRFNVGSVDEYIERLEQDQIAIEQKRQLDEHGKLCRVIVDQLFCYHRLDLSYIENRYDIKINALAENLVQTLNADARVELMHIHNGLLQINDDGIMRILFICDAFLTALSLADER